MDAVCDYGIKRAPECAYPILRGTSFKTAVEPKFAHINEGNYPRNRLDTLHVLRRLDASNIRILPKLRCKKKGSIADRIVYSHLFVHFKFSDDKIKSSKPPTIHPDFGDLEEVKWEG